METESQFIQEWLKNKKKPGKSMHLREEVVL